MVSNSGKSFKATADFLEGVFEDKSVIDHFSSLRMQWLLNIEKASWWGSAFERLICRHVCNRFQMNLASHMISEHKSKSWKPL